MVRPNTLQSPEWQADIHSYFSGALGRRRPNYVCNVLRPGLKFRTRQDPKAGFLQLLQLSPLRPEEPPTLTTSTWVRHIHSSLSRVPTSSSTSGTPCPSPLLLKSKPPHPGSTRLTASLPFLNTQAIYCPLGSQDTDSNSVPRVNIPHSGTARDLKCSR